VTRGGRINETEDPERKCIVSGEVQPKAGLIRFCLGPDGQLVADVMNKLPGRGFYVTANRAMIDKAAKKGLFARAAKQSITVPADLADLVEAFVLRRVIDMISLTRKANAAVMGYEKVKDWLQNGYVNCLTAGELGLAFGRERAIHAALAAGGLTTRVVEEAARLAGLRGQNGQQDGGETALKDT
jgi:predicted RNA-binding protein YlxR (DUF448 family)